MERLSDDRLRELRELYIGFSNVDDAFDVMRALDELIELRAKLDAYKQLDAAQCAQLASYRKEDRRDHAARSTLESEREANRLLTEENDRLRKTLSRIIEVFEYVAPTGGWHEWRKALEDAHATASAALMKDQSR